MLRARYKQVVKDSTFVSAESLLDHVYLRESSLGNFKDVKCEVKVFTIQIMTVCRFVYQIMLDRACYD